MLKTMETLDKLSHCVAWGTVTQKGVLVSVQYKCRVFINQMFSIPSLWLGGTSVLAVGDRVLRGEVGWVRSEKEERLTFLWHVKKGVGGTPKSLEIRGAVVRDKWAWFLLSCLTMRPPWGGCGDKTLLLINSSQSRVTKSSVSSPQPLSSFYIAGFFKGRRYACT